MKTLLLLVTVTAGLSFAESIPQRNYNQHQRVRQGAASGELTARETQRLRHEMQRDQALAARDRRDGGVFTAAERARAQQRQNETSRDIYRLKHNGRTR